MHHYFWQGLLLGIAYVAPIGMQNLYVINTAIRMSRKRAYQVAGITVFFDISLALASFYGIGILLEENQTLRQIFLLLGGLAMTYIGIKLIRAKPLTNHELNVNEPLRRIAVACFTVTWLNPQAIVDGTLILGGARIALPATAAVFFLAGIITASVLWFFTLVTFVSTFQHRINLKILQLINIICGSIIIFFGFKLLNTLVNLF